MRGAYERVAVEDVGGAELKRQTRFPLLLCRLCSEEWPGFKSDVGKRCPWPACGKGVAEQIFFRYVDEEPKNEI